MKVTKVMTQKMITAREDDGIRTAFFRMRMNRVRHLPVVDEHNHLIGMISDRDLRRPDWVDEDHDVAHVYHLDDSMSVGDVMSRNVISVHTYDRLQKAVQIMHEHRFGALPVLNKDEHLAGIVSAIDCLAVLDELLEADYRKHHH